jgi:hypothetical protein
MSGSHTANVLPTGSGWSDSTRRAIRTAVQLVVAVVPVLPTLALFTDGNPPLAAALATMIFYGTAITKILNLLEDNLVWWPAWLKAPASGGQHPVPEVTTPQQTPAQNAADQYGPLGDVNDDLG